MIVFACVDLYNSFLVFRPEQQWLLYAGLLLSSAETYSLVIPEGLSASCHAAHRAPAARIPTVFSGTTLPSPAQHPGPLKVQARCSALYKPSLFFHAGQWFQAVRKLMEIGGRCVADKHLDRL